jgi:hypothetical protein
MRFNSALLDSMAFRQVFGLSGAGIGCFLFGDASIHFAAMIGHSHSMGRSRPGRCGLGLDANEQRAG